MKPDKALIEKFNEGTCTPEERKVVMDWLLENEGDSETVAEWEQSSWKGSYPEAYSAEMWSFIQADTFGEKTKVRWLPWRSLAIAASLLLVTGMFLWRYLLPEPARNTVGGVVLLQDDRQPKDTLWWTYKAGRQWEHLELPDGSRVRLFPGAEIRFDSSAYNTSSRAVFMKGTATFNVAAVAGKPFSVTTEGFTTTALGTEFMVAADEGKKLLVRLYSGKVVIKKTDNHQYAMNDVYMSPGEEWRYSIETHKYVLYNLGDKSTVPQDHINSTAIQVNEDNIVFENAPLNEVIDFLQQHYHVTIHYQKKDFKDVYFSGKMLPGDSLKMVLGNIVRVNELTLTADEGVFIIR